MQLLQLESGYLISLLVQKSFMMDNQLALNSDLHIILEFNTRILCCKPVRKSLKLLEKLEILSIHSTSTQAINEWNDSEFQKEEIHLRSRSLMTEQLKDLFLDLEDIYTSSVLISVQLTFQSSNPLMLERVMEILTISMILHLYSLEDKTLESKNLELLMMETQFTEFKQFTNLKDRLLKDQCIQVLSIHHASFREFLFQKIIRLLNSKEEEVILSINSQLNSTMALHTFSEDKEVIHGQSTFLKENM